MTPEQLRTARKLLGCTTYQVAAWSGVEQQVIATFERTGRVMQAIGPIGDTDRLVLIRTAVEQAGAVFGDTGEVWLRSADS